MRGEDVEFDRLGFDAAAALLGPDHILQAVLLLLEKYLGILVFFLLDSGLKGGVKIGLGAFVEQHLVSAVFLQDEDDFGIDVQGLEDADPILLLLQQST